jgi:hypothetical protein
MEHLIRLRAAWERWEPGMGDELPRRVDLPASWPPGSIRPFRLRRQFHAPPVDPDRETLALRLENVDGLKAVWLNAALIERPATETRSLELDLPLPLPRLNVLELEVDPAGWAETLLNSTAWGSIALVVRLRDESRGAWGEAPLGDREGSV